MGEFPEAVFFFVLFFCPSSADLLEDEIGDGGIGVDNDGGHFVIADLFQQRRRVQVVIQHPD